MLTNKVFRIAAVGALSLVLAGSEHVSAQQSNSQWGPRQARRNQYCPPVQVCPPGTTPVIPAPSEVPPLPPSDGSAPATDPNAPASPNQPIQNQIDNQQVQQPQQFNQALANIDSAGTGLGDAPNMIGDFFGTTGSTPYPHSGIGGPFDGISITASALPYITGNLASAPGSNVGRLKLGENVNIIPQDRVFVNYSHFQNVNIFGGTDVNRITPGFEKKFHASLFSNETLMSVEVRTPFADTVSSNYDTTSGAAPRSATEFGNMSIWGKAVIAEGDSWLMSTGLGLTLPTADDYVLTAGPVEVLSVDNNSVHALPFVGLAYQPGRFFAQTFLQFDVDMNGNTVNFGGVSANARDNNFLFADLSVGYWTYQSHNHSDFIQGIAPIVEIHYNTTLDDGQVIEELNVNHPGNLAVTNMVFGVTSKMSRGKSLTLAYAAPVAGDSQFDGEFRVLFNLIH